MLHLFHYELPLIVNLLLLLLAAKVLGEIMERFGQPSMIGEVLAGIILGPSLFNIIPSIGDLRVIADLGVFFLIVMAGLEIEAEELRNTIRGKQFWIAVFGFVIPFFSGFALGQGFGFSITLTVFLSLSMAITALPVTIRILMDLGRLQSDIGRRIIFSAIFNDVLALLVLGILLDFNETPENVRSLGLPVLLSVLKILVFVIILLIAYKLFRMAKIKMPSLNPKMNNFLELLQGKESVFALVILYVLFFASISELLGLYFVIGAFFGAILLPRSLFEHKEIERVKSAMAGITSGFLAPVFFGSIGLTLTLHNINHPLFFLQLVIIAFSSKILGGFIGGRLAGLSPLGSFAIGIGLNAHGIMELVIANIAYSLGFIDLSMFSMLILMALISTMATPFLLGRTFKLIDKSKL